MAKYKSAVAVDLSAVPSSVRDAVGADLAHSIVRNMKLSRRPVVVGRLAAGLYGFILPGATLLEEIRKAIRRLPK